MPTHYGEVRKLWRLSWRKGGCLRGQEDRPACSEGVEVTAPTMEGAEEGGSRGRGHDRPGRGVGRAGGRGGWDGRRGAWGHGGVVDLCLVSFCLLCLGVKVLFFFFLLFALVCFLAGLGRRRRCETLTMTAQAGPGVGKGYTGGKGPLFSLLVIARGSGMLP